MFETLNRIADTLSSIINFIVDFFRNVVELCQMMYKGIATVSLMIQYLPIQYQIFFTALIAYMVIFFIIKLGG